MLDHLICVLNQKYISSKLGKKKFKYSERNEIIELMVYLHYSGEPCLPAVRHAHEKHLYDYTKLCSTVKIIQRWGKSRR